MRAKRRNHFISFISLTSMLGIALGVTTLITVISVMNGFEKELTGAHPGRHCARDDSTGRWRSDGVAHRSLTGGRAPRGRWRGALHRGGRVAAGRRIVRGIHPRSRSRNLKPGYRKSSEKMLSGELTDLRPGEYGIILGIGLASRLAGRARRPRHGYRPTAESDTGRRQSVDATLHGGRSFRIRRVRK